MDTPIVADSPYKTTYIPFFAVAPLTPEQAAAAEQADLARWRIDQRIEEMRWRPAPRGPRCWAGPTLHIRRDRPDGAGIEDGLIRYSCGRSDCPHCWRRRLTRTYRRAAGSLLDESAESRLPRLGALYVAETSWEEWETYDRAIRRQHGGDVGRLRVRRADNAVLVVCAQPIHGGRAVTPAEAVDLVSAAIEGMHTARHAYRQLGDWSDSPPSDWRLVARHKRLDMDEVRCRLEAAQVRSRRFASPDVYGLLWRPESEDHALRLEALITAPAELCPTLTIERTVSLYGQSRTAPQRQPRRAPGDCDTARVYARAIARACRKAGVPE